MCSSPKVMKFIDGFGDNRVYCKGCGRSFLENNFSKMKNQTRLIEWRIDSMHTGMIQR
jgi:hypothetical protein